MYFFGFFQNQRNNGLFPAKFVTFRLNLHSYDFEKTAKAKSNYFTAKISPYFWCKTSLVEYGGRVFLSFYVTIRFEAYLANVTSTVLFFGVFPRMSKFYPLM